MGQARIKQEQCIYYLLVLRKATSSVCWCASGSKISTTYGVSLKQIRGRVIKQTVERTLSHLCCCSDFSRVARVAYFVGQSQVIKVALVFGCRDMQVGIQMKQLKVK